MGRAEACQPGQLEAALAAFPNEHSAVHIQARIYKIQEMQIMLCLRGTHRWLAVRSMPWLRVMSMSQALDVTVPHRGVKTG